MSVTPLQYASRLAGYISDPSTIRARTMEEFGRAPSVDQCMNLRKAKIAERDTKAKSLGFFERYSRPFRCGHPQTSSNTIIYENGIDRCLECHNLRIAEQMAKVEESAKIEREKAQAAERLRAEKLAQLKIQGEVVSSRRVMIATDTLEKVSKLFGISYGELIGDERTRHLVDARAVAAMAFHKSGASYPQIKKWMHRKCHSSIINLVSSWDARVKARPHLKTILDSVA